MPDRRAPSAPGGPLPMTTDQIIFRAGYKYQLGDEHRHWLPAIFSQVPEFDYPFYSLIRSPESRGPFLCGKVGYAWDGPSGPTFDTKSFMRGSLVHDLGYQALREGALPRYLTGQKGELIDTREWFDEELGRICREDGMSWLSAKIVEHAVKRYGFKSSTKGRPWLTAP